MVLYSEKEAFFKLALSLTHTANSQEEKKPRFALHENKATHLHQKRRRGRAGRNIERKRDTFEFCIFFSKLICQGKKGKVIAMLLLRSFFAIVRRFRFVSKRGHPSSYYFSEVEEEP